MRYDLRVMFNRVPKLESEIKRASENMKKCSRNGRLREARQLQSDLRHLNRQLREAKSALASVGA